jgi:hypothetical protein
MILAIAMSKNSILMTLQNAVGVLAKTATIQPHNAFATNKIPMKMLIILAAATLSGSTQILMQLAIATPLPAHRLMT